MKLGKFTIIAMMITAACAGLCTEAQAAGGNESCLVTTLADIKNAAKLNGTAAVQINDWGGPTTSSAASSVVATLTLSYKGTTAIFTATDLTPGTIVSPEAVMCNALDAGAETSTGATIFDVFGFPTPAAPHDTLKLCLVTQPKVGSKSQSDTVICQSIDQLSINPIPNTTNWTAIVNKLTIYVIQ